MCSFIEQLKILATCCSRMLERFCVLAFPYASINSPHLTAWCTVLLVADIARHLTTEIQCNNKVKPSELVQRC